MILLGYLLVGFHMVYTFKVSKTFRRISDENSIIFIFSSSNQTDITEAERILNNFLNPCNIPSIPNPLIVRKDIECSKLTSNYSYIAEFETLGCDLNFDSPLERQGIVVEHAIIEGDCQCSSYCVDNLLLFRYPGCKCEEEKTNTSFHDTCQNFLKCSWVSHGFHPVIFNTPFHSFRVIQYYMAKKEKEYIADILNLTSPFYSSSFKLCSLSLFYYISGANNTSIRISLVARRASKIEEIRILGSLFPQTVNSKEKFKYIDVNIGEIKEPTAVVFTVQDYEENAEIGISNLTWHDCNPVFMDNTNSCDSLIHPFKCHGSSQCLEDIECDGYEDCFDGSDEKNCDKLEQDQCSFTNTSMCNGWSIEKLSNLSDDKQYVFIGSSNRSLNSTYHLPISKNERDKDGTFLVFWPHLLREHDVPDQTNFLTSPLYLPIRNHEICTVRFMYCTMEENYDFSLHLRNIKNQTVRLWNVPHHLRKSELCEWHRAVVYLGSPKISFSLEFQVRYQKDITTNFIAIDSFTMNPYCYAKIMKKFFYLIAVITNYLDHFILIMKYIVVIFLIFSICLFIHFKNYIVEQTRKIISTVRNIATTIVTRDQYSFIELSELAVSSSKSLSTLSNDQLLKLLPVLHRNTIQLKNVIGHGAFGEVFKAELHQNGKRSCVAVKVLNQRLMKTESAKREFIMEAALMRSSNTAIDATIKLIGGIFDNIPHMIVMELMSGGNLLEFLRTCRSTEDDRNPQGITVRILTKFALDIAEGCAKIEQLRYVHRDLAARNCLLTHRGPGMRVKIGDFGLAKELYSCYFSLDALRGKMVLPIKWMPPEAVEDGFFCSKTDVWSFGVVCWEIFSLGTVPYPTETVQSVITLLRSGKRLSAPKGTPYSVYKLMIDCWATYPECRPSFANLHALLAELIDSSEIVNANFFGIIEQSQLWESDEHENFQNEILDKKICKPYTGLSIEQKRLFLETDFAVWTNEGFIPSPLSETPGITDDMFLSGRSNLNTDTKTLL